MEHNIVFGMVDGSQISPTWYGKVLEVQAERTNIDRNRCNSRLEFILISSSDENVQHIVGEPTMLLGLRTETYVTEPRVAFSKPTVK